MTLKHRASPFLAPSMACSGAATRAAADTTTAMVTNPSRSHRWRRMRSISLTPLRERICAGGCPVCLSGKNRRPAFPKTGRRGREGHSISISSILRVNMVRNCRAGKTSSVLFQLCH